MIELVPCTLEVAQAVLAGEDPGLPHAADWPHTDTFDALLALAEHPAESGPGTFLVVLDGVVVGDCGWFGPPDEQGEVEIGYGLAASVRGRGLGTEAVRLLLAWVEAQGARRVRAEVLPGNAPSFALLARLGFAPVAERAGHVVLVRDAGHEGSTLPVPDSAG